MHRFLEFLEDRATQLLRLENAKTIEERWMAGCLMLQPCLPHQFRHFGSVFNQFPPRLYKDECCIIILNHTSDLDWAYLMSLMHTTLVPRQVQPMAPASQSKQQHSNQNPGQLFDLTSDPQSPTLEHPYKTIRPIAFTHDVFSKSKLIGKLVKNNLIGLYKGMTDEELDRRIQERVDQHYNTFVLFPEGAIHSKENHEKSIELWNTTLYPDESTRPEYPFKNVFLPKPRCWSRLIRVLGTRLKYVCDLTFLYPKHEPWKGPWDYHLRPSIVDAMTEKMSKVYTHTRLIDCRGYSLEQIRALSTIESLMKIWRKKERRLLWLRQKEREERSNR